MKIHYYGNACFSIITENLHILCDPWLNGPAVADGWEKFPPSSTRVRDLPKIDYVYISHIHSDHCEYNTLREIDLKTPILILDRVPNFLLKMLRGMGFKDIRTLKEGSQNEIENGLRVEVFGVTTGHICAEIIDSSVIFDVDGCVLVNCNDNHPTDEFCYEVKSKYRGVDVAFLPAGGGSGYPAAYTNLQDEEKEIIAKNAIDRFTDEFINAVDLLSPKTVIPVGGGYVIRGKNARNLNKYQVRRLNLTPLVEIYRERGKTEARILPMQPEMVYSVADDKIVSGKYKVWSTSEVEEFIERLEREPITMKLTTTRKCPSLFNILNAVNVNFRNKQKALNIFPDYIVYIKINTIETFFAIDLSQDTTIWESREIKQSNKPHMTLNLSQDTLLEWLLGFEDFNMLDSGHRIEFNRQPNKYVVEAYYLLSLFRF
jgi:UDP-MurNAc hydroxylase